MSLTLPTFSVQDLLERGVHFGHKRARWNPKMAPYIFKEHHGVHIIDLPQTIERMQQAFQVLFDCVKEGGRILFVGTKVQARAAIKEAALRCGQYYVNHRWLGGTLTNWRTVSESLKKLREIEDKISSDEFSAYTKKEQLDFHRRLEKYKLALGGIRDMGGLPDMLFVLDINKEMVAVREARHLGIPIIAVVDTNTDPSLVTYPIPGNDDALRAIEYYCDGVARTIIAGLQAEWNQRSQRGQQGAGSPTEGEPIVRPQRMTRDAGRSDREFTPRKAGESGRSGSRGFGASGGSRSSRAPRATTGGRENTSNPPSNPVS